MPGFEEPEKCVDGILLRYAHIVQGPWGQVHVTRVRLDARCGFADPRL
jgi:hypothetical protein